MRKIGSLFIVIMLLSLAMSVTSAQESVIPSVTQTQFQQMPEDLRDYRYCEILPIYRDGMTITVEVYNTIGLNDCPDELWVALDAESITQSHSLLETKLNGPRYWVMNAMVGRGDSRDGNVADFGGIEMTLRAILEPEIGDATVGETLYTENQVQRDTTFTYRAGNMVYELTSPDGDVYRMQSYSQMIDPTLTIDDLETLGERLELPDGWTYQARVLAEDSELVADGVAYVINDEFANAYQKITDAQVEQSTTPQVNNLVATGIRNQIIENNTLQAEIAAELQRTDQISVVLVGTGSPLARTGAQTATAVFVNGQFLLFDVGNNAMQSMYDSNIPVEEVDAVFITHFHNDHYAELGDIMEWSWILGRRHILPIYGPTGIVQIVDGFTSAYELERGYRTGHHGEELMPPEWSGTETVEFTTPTGNAASVVYENDGVVVKAFAVNHEPVEPSVGYRIEYADTVIVISGDTVLTSSLLENSQNADLLVAEVMNMAVVTLMEEANREAGNEDAATILFDIRDYHMDVSDVAELARDANVQRLALNHLAPKPPNPLQLNQLFVDPIRDIYDGEIFAGEDGLTIVVPLENQ